MKKLYAILHQKKLRQKEFYSQQDDTKIVNFDEGVLIYGCFSEAMSFLRFALLSQVTIYVPKIFHCLASPGKVSALAL